MSAVYGSFREARMTWLMSGIVPLGLSFWVAGVNEFYEFSHVHTSVDDLGTLTLESRQLESVVFTGGIMDAADVEWIDLTPGDTLAAVVIYLVDEDLNTYLVCHIDQSSDTSIPGAVVFEHGWVRWSSNGIVKL